MQGYFFTRAMIGIRSNKWFVLLISVIFAASYLTLSFKEKRHHIEKSVKLPKSQDMSPELTQYVDRKFREFSENDSVYRMVRGSIDSKLVELATTEYDKVYQNYDHRGRRVVLADDGELKYQADLQEKMKVVLQKQFMVSFDAAERRIDISGVVHDLEFGDAVLKAFVNSVGVEFLKLFDERISAIRKLMANGNATSQGVYNETLIKRQMAELDELKAARTELQSGILTTETLIISKSQTMVWRDYLEVLGCGFLGLILAMTFFTMIEFSSRSFTTIRETSRYLGAEVYGHLPDLRGNPILEFGLDDSDSSSSQSAVRRKEVA